MIVSKDLVFSNACDDLILFLYWNFGEFSVKFIMRVVQTDISLSNGSITDDLKNYCELELIEPNYFMIHKFKRLLFNNSLVSFNKNKENTSLIYCFSISCVYDLEMSFYLFFMRHCKLLSMILTRYKLENF
ncbi:LOW QUALITY PROTEIN: hypothetical protein T552_04104 [Pneumocystis carinii B80]|uniref:Uncharacterized protein n=1 Tax=Pneumocystis carinii (strain B80) TaxID=1408658 RepID=A0A0W4ZLJ4_PNEC8|nr:LOW QUALITY PROTEIN: hypothetical protein T552_04104 [Pneumocystis carinii B80]KTW29235.1 LOW QUALITY PROTEIN: hypothetical protein T552_04104 [Pneumocystis carinii B80]